MDAKARETARHIWTAWTTNALLDGLPPAARPATVAEGDAVQAALRALAGPQAGWKLAATSAAGQAHINVSGPLPGRLFARFALAPDEPVSTEGMHMGVAEPEFVFVLGRDLPGAGDGRGPYSRPEVLDAVAELRLGIELPDSRFATFTGAGEAQLLADDACAGRFVVGPAAPAGWRELDLSRTPVHAALDGVTVSEGSGANVLGDPRDALTWLANVLPARGAELEAGEIVFTGVCTAPVPVPLGGGPAELVATFGDGLGSVATTFVQPDASAR